MNKILRAAQIINIIGLTALASNITLRSVLSENILRTSLAINGTLALLGLVVVMIFSVLFLRKFENEEGQSSSLSPFYKYLFPNLSISVSLLLLTLGCFYDFNLLKVFFVWSLLTIVPVWIYLKSSYVIAGTDKIIVSNYTETSTVLLNDIKSVRSAFFNLIWKLSYTDNKNLKRSVFFFPKGGLFLFSVSPHFQKLKEAISHK